VDAYYAGLLCIGENRSISVIIICVGGTAIFANTGIQKTIALSSTETEVIAGCAAEKIVKYFRKDFTNLRFPPTRPTPVGEDNAGTILISNHNHPGGRTRHLDIHYFASQEWIQLGLMKYFKICGTVNPADAMSKVLYRIIFYRHYDRVEGYFGSPYTTHDVFLEDPNDNTPAV
jgi:hypothetical protein